MILRKPLEKDAYGMLEWMHSEETKKIFATNFEKFTIDDVLNFIEHSNDDPNNVNFVCVDDNDDYLGTVSLKNIDAKAKNAEYAISFLPKAQGTGAAGYATLKILEYAFNELGLEKVYLNVITKNVRANKFYKKIGFVFEGEFRNHIVVNNQLENLCWYGMLKEDFIKSPVKD